MAANKLTKAGLVRLYRFDLDCGRHGSLEGIFIATEAEVTTAFGKRCYFGEVLGKHSEVTIDEFAAEYVKLLTDDAAFIVKAQEFGLVPMGFNPLQAIMCDRCGDCLPAPYTKCGDTKCRKRAKEVDDASRTGEAARGD